MKLLFLGMPGVGKGTYAQELKKVLGIPHISSGDLLREEVAKGTDLGEKAHTYMKSGQLVPDNLIVKIIEHRITQDDCKDGFILDGFPRTKDQALLLHELVEISHVLHFKADDEVIIERLSGRLVCRNCKTIYHPTGNKPKKENICDGCGGELHRREDDQPDIIKRRLEEDGQKTRPLIDHYRDQGLLVEIVMNKSISEVREKFISTMKDYFEGKITHIGEIK